MNPVFFDCGREEEREGGGEGERERERGRVGEKIIHYQL